MSTGTPGPWFVKRRTTKYDDLFEYDVASDKYTVAQSLDCPHDAALIAAAPDLLAACRSALSLWEIETETDDGVHTLLPDSRGNLWRELDAAITKATAT